MTTDPVVTFPPAPELSIGYIDDVGVTALLDYDDWDTEAMESTSLTIGLVDDSSRSGKALVQVTQAANGKSRRAHVYLPFPLLARAIDELRDHEDVNP